MASEVLAVPEGSLAEVIRVIRAGLLRERKISRETRRNLTKWCDEEQAYLNRNADIDTEEES
jgi:hypothetical protein